MKKLLSLLAMLCLIFSLAACSNSAENPTETEQQTDSNSSEAALLDETLDPFSVSASLSETVMYDEGGVKITATGLNYTNYSVELELTIENNSGKDLSFISGSLGYSCNSINGYMVSAGYLNCDVANGKKANDSISFSYDELMLYGINEIADIEIGFDISDSSYNHTYSGPRQVKTSAFDAHNYDEDHYQQAITSHAVINAYNYDIIHFSQDVLYDVNGVNLLSSGVMKNQDSEFILLLEFENTTSDMVYMSTSDIAINNLVVCSSTWSNNAINPGKRGIIDIVLSSVLDSKYWDTYGIKEVGAITLSLSQLNSDGNELAEKTFINIAVPGAKTEYDTSGTEVYNSNGLRIISKGIVEDSSEYSSDLYVLLLAENKSGKTLTISDAYNSLSVNGFMADYSYYSKELTEGECAALEIKLWESSLEDNGIASASDINEIEVGFEIKEGRNTIDEPVIKIVFD